MKTPLKLPFSTLLMLISFASVNAVLFTPGLPNISHYFAISADQAQQTITWFLIGYAFGQLLYGPLAKRFDRKPTLYIGIFIQICSSFLCLAAGFWQQFSLLIVGRFFLALGSGVGLTLAFMLVNECYEVAAARRAISFLTLAFAITPAIAVAIGGVLNAHFGWQSCFYASALYGLLVLMLVTQLPHTGATRDPHALQLKNLWQAYAIQFKQSELLSGAFIMGIATSYIYVFAAVAPFVAMNILGLNSAHYGFANLIPGVGLMCGSLTSAKLSHRFAVEKIMRAGVYISGVGVSILMLSHWLTKPNIYTLFLPITLIYFGLSLIVGNASSFALRHNTDKAHGSAVLSFINMSTATLAVLSLKAFPITLLLMPAVFCALWFASWCIQKFTF